MKYNASKIVKNAEMKTFASGGILSGKQITVEHERCEMVIPRVMSDTDIDSILQARLRQIEQRDVKQ